MLWTYDRKEKENEKSETIRTKMSEKEETYRNIRFVITVPRFAILTSVHFIYFIYNKWIHIYMHRLRIIINTPFMIHVIVSFVGVRGIFCCSVSISLFFSFSLARACSDVFPRIFHFKSMSLLNCWYVVSMYFGPYFDCLWTTETYVYFFQIQPL